MKSDLRARDLAPLRPFALAAASVLRCLSERPGLVGATDLVLAGQAGTTAANAATVSRLLRSWDWVRSGTGGRPTIASRPLLLSLADRLVGLADADELDAGPLEVEPVVTLPPGGQLTSALDGRLNAHFTPDGFAHVAANAKRRLTLLVPFIDEQGAAVLGKLLSNTPAPDKTVFVRPDRGGRYWHKDYDRYLASSGTRFLYYWFAGEDGRRSETFHAKIAIADDNLAYVGSSNFMATSLEHSLEAGVLLRGDLVRPWADLIDTLEAVCHDCTL